MGIATTVKNLKQAAAPHRNRVRLQHGGRSTPSQQAIEAVAADAYFWRR